MQGDVVVGSIFHSTHFLLFPSSLFQSLYFSFMNELFHFFRFQLSLLFSSAGSSCCSIFLATFSSFSFTKFSVCVTRSGIIESVSERERQRERQREREGERERGWVAERTGKRTSIVTVHYPTTVFLFFFRWSSRQLRLGQLRPATRQICRCSQLYCSELQPVGRFVRPTPPWIHWLPVATSPFINRFARVLSLLSRSLAFSTYFWSFSCPLSVVHLKVSITVSSARSSGLYLRSSLLP